MFAEFEIVYYSKFFIILLAHPHEI